MIIQPVNSNNGGQEGKWIAFLCALIIGVGALLLPYNSASEAHQDVAQHQLPINSLTSLPLSMIADLRLADEEIRYMHESTQQWLSVAQLEADWIAPFVKDKSWLHQGEHLWLQVVPGVYQSTPAKGGIRYLLNSRDTHLDIWVDLSEQATLLSVDSDQETQLQDADFIKLGWKQVLFKSEVDDAHAH